ncbi:HET-domain-containing protein [Byssothecium circinans]|uniref:HET-domain-containing protein n=1 Tax=Byssothecium circinans TaxID=147558 RepID=A0A6A5TLZ0_9PLEO|nr:HET-domain-containing protein [Byssothecium circinans]
MEPLSTTASVFDASEVASYINTVADAMEDRKRLGEEVRACEYIQLPSDVVQNRQSPAKRKLEEYHSDQHAADSPDYPAFISRPRAKGPPDLCTRCSSIQFDRMFAANINTRKGAFQIDLGPIKGEWNTSCQVCCLFAAMQLPGTPKDQRGQLVAFSSLRSYPANNCHDRTPRNCPMVTDTIFLGVLPSTRNSFQLRELSEAGFIATSDPSGVTETSKFEGRALNPETVDFDTLKSWMSYCECHHTRTCGTQDLSSVDFVPLLRVIDCERRIITSQNPKTCRYLALSYVWGDAPSAEQMEWSEKLPETLPNVIEDAIVLALKLDHRFLWVDRYCIKQNDEKDRLTQIHNMDGIYKNAFACIIAAAGSDSTFGLPGVSTVPRIPQNRAMVGNRLLVSTMPSIKAVLKSSTWSTRAWTYQEGLLSRRRLIFTKYQVYYDCLVMSCAEAIHEPLDALHTKNKQSLRAFTDFRPLFPRVDSKSAWELIADYSSRPLTKIDDALNAMLGIFSTLQKQDEIKYQIWGIPIRRGSQYDRKAVPSRTWQDLFVSGLIWASERPSKRRPSFPSWSWVGWCGTVFSMGWTLAQFYVADYTEVWLESLEETARPKFGHKIRIKAPLINVRISSKGERDVWEAEFQTCKHGITQTELHLTREANVDKEFCRRLQENAFTGIIVGQEPNDATDERDLKFLVVLVVDWVNESQRVAERIGFFVLWNKDIKCAYGTCDYHSIPATMKEVTLM